MERAARARARRGEYARARRGRSAARWVRRSTPCATGLDPPPLLAALCPSTCDARAKIAATPPPFCRAQVCSPACVRHRPQGAHQNEGQARARRERRNGESLSGRTRERGTQVPCRHAVLPARASCTQRATSHATLFLAASAGACATSRRERARKSDLCLRGRRRQFKSQTLRQAGSNTGLGAQLSLNERE